MKNPAVQSLLFQSWGWKPVDKHNMRIRGLQAAQHVSGVSCAVQVRAPGERMQDTEQQGLLVQFFCL